jgi:hypothetical protein
MPEGSYGQLGKSGAEKLKDWVRSGGTLIAQGNAMSWLDQQEVAAFKFKTVPYEDKQVQRRYADFENAMGARVTGGAIMNVKLDVTHPLGYGYTKAELFSFRDNNLFLQTSENPYANVMVYPESPLASGYLHPSNRDQIKNTAAIKVSGQGQGRVIGMADNANFRAFWFGTNKLFLNAVFFGQTINSGTAR